MYKFFHDSIHGTIKLNNFSIKIIDTPEFQRLREIKQLGSAIFVYHTASHSRFEHSIGVAHMAVSMLNKIKLNQPELKITEQDLINIEIAGLCHDLGHGPFSHLFDNYFLESKFKNNELKKHENRSCFILEKIVKKYKIGISFDNLKKIKNMIYPDKNHENIFLYQIVCNNTYGIDVDKLDYLIRDAYSIGLNFGISFFRFFDNFKVINNEIYFLDKEIYNIYEIYHIRFRMHKQIYGHDVVKKIDRMISDIFLLLFNSESKYFKFSEILDNNLDYFCSLNDNILDKIELVYENDKDECDIYLEKAYILYKRIKNRDLYLLHDKIENIENIKDIILKYSLKV